ncbi:MAG: hypothetical protein IKL97_05710 [Eggerthellaceae bacterium]|nr:hypothetical protein [Eggerthellaceae bacterium]
MSDQATCSLLEELSEAVSKYLEGYREAICAMASIMTDEQLRSLEERHREFIVAAVEMTAAMETTEGGNE